MKLSLTYQLEHARTIENKKEVIEKHFKSIAECYSVDEHTREIGLEHYNKTAKKYISKIKRRKAGKRELSSIRKELYEKYYLSIGDKERPIMPFIFS